MIVMTRCYWYHRDKVLLHRALTGFHRAQVTHVSLPIEDVISALKSVVSFLSKQLVEFQKEETIRIVSFWWRRSVSIRRPQGYEPCTIPRRNFAKHWGSPSVFVVRARVIVSSRNQMLKSPLKGKEAYFHFRAIGKRGKKNNKWFKFQNWHLQGEWDEREKQGTLYGVAQWIPKGFNFHTWLFFSNHSISDKNLSTR